MTMKATCILSGECSGVIKLEQNSSCTPTKLTGEVKGLTPGKHGFHVHEFGDLSDGCTSAGAHYNPFQTKHGGPCSEERHVGDLGNLLADNNGVAKVDITDNIITLHGELSVIGRSLVVHAKEDDLGLGNSPESPTTGNSGARVCCGVIGLSKS
ncbi:hypothetical protein GJ496_009172 [Pomphorhynchus laevis]|nr:hypothetical protein GJ496_009172 [Pomphorhynchus laevis]